MKNSAGFVFTFLLITFVIKTNAQCKVGNCVFSDATVGVSTISFDSVSGYSPACIRIEVGDSVTFSGDFDSFPLVPGAYGFSSSSGPLAKLSSLAPGTTTALVSFPSQGIFPFFGRTNVSLSGAIYVSAQSSCESRRPPSVPDSCDAAIDVGVFPQSISVTNMYAETVFNVSCSSSKNNIIPTTGLWFKFVGTGRHGVRISTCGGPSFDTYLAVWAGPSCPSSTTQCIASSDDAWINSGCSGIAISYTQPGQVFYVLLAGSGTNDVGNTSVSFELMQPWALAPTNVAFCSSDCPVFTSNESIVIEGNYGPLSPATARIEANGLSWTVPCVRQYTSVYCSLPQRPIGVVKASINESSSSATVFLHPPALIGCWLPNITQISVFNVSVTTTGYSTYEVVNFHVDFEEAFSFPSSMADVCGRRVLLRATSQGVGSCDWLAAGLSNRHMLKCIIYTNARDPWATPIPTFIEFGTGGRESLSTPFFIQRGALLLTHNVLCPKNSSDRVENCTLATENLGVADFFIPLAMQYLRSDSILRLTLDFHEQAYNTATYPPYLWTYDCSQHWIFVNESMLLCNFTIAAQNAFRASVADNIGAAWFVRVSAHEKGASSAADAGFLVLPADRVVISSNKFELPAAIGVTVPIFINFWLQSGDLESLNLFASTPDGRELALEPSNCTVETEFPALINCYNVSTLDLRGSVIFANATVSGQILASARVALVSPAFLLKCTDLQCRAPNLVDVVMPIDWTCATQYSNISACGNGMILELSYESANRSLVGSTSSCVVTTYGYYQGRYSLRFTCPPVSEDYTYGMLFASIGGKYNISSTELGSPYFPVVYVAHWTPAYVADISRSGGRMQLFGRTLAQTQRVSLNNVSCSNLHATRDSISCDLPPNNGLSSADRIQVTTGAGDISYQQLIWINSIDAPISVAVKSCNGYRCSVIIYVNLPQNAEFIDFFISINGSDGCRLLPYNETTSSCSAWFTVENSATRANVQLLIYSYGNNAMRYFLVPEVSVPIELTTFDSSNKFCAPTLPTCAWALSALGLEPITLSFSGFGFLSLLQYPVEASIAVSNMYPLWYISCDSEYSLIINDTALQCVISVEKQMQLISDLQSTGSPADSQLWGLSPRILSGGRSFSVESSYFILASAARRIISKDRLPLVPSGSFRVVEFELSDRLSPSSSLNIRLFANDMQLSVDACTISSVHIRSRITCELVDVPLVTNQTPISAEVQADNFTYSMTPIAAVEFITIVPGTPPCEVSSEISCKIRAILPKGIYPESRGTTLYLTFHGYENALPATQTSCDGYIYSSDEYRDLSCYISSELMTSYAFGFIDASLVVLGRTVSVAKIMRSMVSPTLDDIDFGDREADIWSRDGANLMLRGRFLQATKSIKLNGQDCIISNRNSTIVQCTLLPGGRFYTSVPIAATLRTDFGAVFTLPIWKGLIIQSQVVLRKCPTECTTSDILLRHSSNYVRFLSDCTVLWASHTFSRFTCSSWLTSSVATFGPSPYLKQRIGLAPALYPPRFDSQNRVCIGSRVCRLNLADLGASDVEIHLSGLDFTSAVPLARLDIVFDIMNSNRTIYTLRCFERTIVKNSTLSSCNFGVAEQLKLWEIYASEGLTGEFLTTRAQTSWGAVRDVGLVVVPPRANSLDFSTEIVPNVSSGNKTLIRFALNRPIAMSEIEYIEFSSLDWTATAPFCRQQSSFQFFCSVDLPFFPDAQINATISTNGTQITATIARTSSLAVFPLSLAPAWCRCYSASISLFMHKSVNCSESTYCYLSANLTSFFAAETSQKTLTRTLSSVSMYRSSTDSDWLGRVDVPLEPSIADFEATSVTLSIFSNNLTLSDHFIGYIGEASIQINNLQLTIAQLTEIETNGGIISFEGNNLELIESLELGSASSPCAIVSRFISRLACKIPAGTPLISGNPRRMAATVRSLTGSVFTRVVWAHLDVFPDPTCVVVAPCHSCSAEIGVSGANLTLVSGVREGSLVSVASDGRSMRISIRYYKTRIYFRLDNIEFATPEMQVCDLRPATELPRADSPNKFCAWWRSNSDSEFSCFILQSTFGQTGMSLYFSGTNFVSAMQINTFRIKFQNSKNTNSAVYSLDCSTSWFYVNSTRIGCPMSISQQNTLKQAIGAIDDGSVVTTKFDIQIGLESFMLDQAAGYVLLRALGPRVINEYESLPSVQPGIRIRSRAAGWILPSPVPCKLVRASWSSRVACYIDVPQLPGEYLVPVGTIGGASLAPDVSIARVSGSGFGQCTETGRCFPSSSSMISVLFYLPEGANSGCINSGGRTVNVSLIFTSQTSGNVSTQCSAFVSCGGALPFLARVSCPIPASPELFFAGPISAFAHINGYNLISGQDRGQIGILLPQNLLTLVSFCRNHTANSTCEIMFDTQYAAQILSISVPNRDCDLVKTATSISCVLSRSSTVQMSYDAPKMDIKMTSGFSISEPLPVQPNLLVLPVLIRPSCPSCLTRFDLFGDTYRVESVFANNWFTQCKILSTGPSGMSLACYFSPNLAANTLLIRYFLLDILFTMKIDIPSVVSFDSIGFVASPPYLHTPALVNTDIVVAQRMSNFSLDVLYVRLFGWSSNQSFSFSAYECTSASSRLRLTSTGDLVCRVDNSTWTTELVYGGASSIRQITSLLDGYSPTGDYSQASTLVAYLWHRPPRFHSNSNPVPVVFNEALLVPIGCTDMLFDRSSRAQATARVANSVYPVQLYQNGSGICSVHFSSAPVAGDFTLTRVSSLGLTFDVTDQVSLASIWVVETLSVVLYFEGTPAIDWISTLEPALLNYLSLSPGDLALRLVDLLAEPIAPPVSSSVKRQAWLQVRRDLKIDFVTYRAILVHQDLMSDRNKVLRLNEFLSYQTRSRTIISELPPVGAQPINRNDQANQSTSSGAATIGIAVGATIGFLLVMAAIVFVVVLKRRRVRRNSKPSAMKPTHNEQLTEAPKSSGFASPGDSGDLKNPHVDTVGDSSDSTISSADPDSESSVASSNSSSQASVHSASPSELQDDAASTSPSFEEDGSNGPSMASEEDSDSR